MSPRLSLLALAAGACLAQAAGPDPSRHWAFQPVREPAPPRVDHPSWCRSALDRFVLARLEAKGVAPAPEADRRTLARRLSLDLTGLPPTAEEVDAFVADPAPDAHERLVDRLLASPHYGEHWGRHWLDVVRYADTAGETADYPVPVAWRYRNYVIDAFNADKPYDEFLREQLAGDLLARTGPRERYAERVVATGFLAVSRRFGFDSENYHHLTLQDTIDTVGQSVLGLTLGCARCHTHKYDPVPMSDYYALYGIFESTRYAFPGSEQKQRHRALAPLVPPEESRPAWRAFEARVASLSRLLEANQKPVPSATLRSLDDLDGDFEMQAPAAGGSKGVLVPPWVYDGPIAVTADAQSPFRNLHPSGRVGASVASGGQPYRMGQSVRRRPGGVLHANLDFRTGTNDPAATGAHAFRLLAADGQPLVEARITSTTLSLVTAGVPQPVRTLLPGRWHNLQLDLDLDHGTVSGRAGVPGDVAAIPSRPLARVAAREVDRLELAAVPGTGTAWPSVAWDNLGLEETPVPAVTTEPPSGIAGLEGMDPTPLRRRIEELAGIDGDFELQSDGTPPATPWGPGPNSAVRVGTGSQSPFRNLCPPGTLGLHLPGGTGYEGFGQTMARRWDKASGVVHAAFDFRCAAPASGAAQGGTWRFYLGHGPGSSAAVELFFNDTAFFRRSGGSRDPVGPLRAGEWHQVRLELDLVNRRYTGTLDGPAGPAAFSGAFAEGWDGVVDYTFIDSYGHQNGPRAAVDADNFVVRATPLRALSEGPADWKAHDAGARRREVAALRERLASASAQLDGVRRELERLLAEGPVELAYAVGEGTPQDARVQLRGEPDRPGEVVRRGFLSALGGGPLPSGTRGSGRLELAQWITSPSHPLTARVIVNRVWQYHFGTALVRTPNDFGLRGQPPSNPELLDHLASLLVREGWSLKRLHRHIVTSAVYRQQGRLSVATAATTGAVDAADPAACPVSGPPPWASAPTAAASPDDDFSPFARRRLGAEEVRDAILASAGRLDTAPGRGHPFPAPTAWGYTQHGPFTAVYDAPGRSVYLMAQRIQRHPFLALFDGADPNTSTAARRTTTVPTQALYFLNDPFVHANAAALAARTRGTDGDPADRIDRLYRRALGRSAGPSERADGVAFVAAYRARAGKDADGEAAWAALARVLFGSNEFLTVD